MSDFEVCAIGTQARLAAVEAERDALLRVMDLVASGLEADGRTLDGMTKAVAAVKLRAAIAKVKGGGNG